MSAKQTLFKNYIDWTQSQKNTSWYVITFKCPKQVTNKSWNDALKDFFRELSQTKRDAGIRKILKQMSVKEIRRILFYGGSKEDAKLVHVQGLIDGIGLDSNTFGSHINEMWKRKVKKYSRKNSIPNSPELDSSVYLEVFDGGFDKYLNYCARPEGKEHGSHSEKYDPVMIYLGETVDSQKYASDMARYLSNPK